MHRITSDMTICQSDYPLDWYQSEFIPYAEEYQALPDRKLTTVLAWMTRNRFEPFLQFVSGGDTSYPGLVWHNNELWVSFYSSHEGKANIYLDRVALPTTP